MAARLPVPEPHHRARAVPHSGRCALPRSSNDRGLYSPSEHHARTIPPRKAGLEFRGIPGALELFQGTAGADFPWASVCPLFPIGHVPARSVPGERPRQVSPRSPGTPPKQRPKIGGPPNTRPGPENYGSPFRAAGLDRGPARTAESRTSATSVKARYLSGPHPHSAGTVCGPSTCPFNKRPPRLVYSHSRLTATEAVQWAPSPPRSVHGTPSEDGRDPVLRRRRFSRPTAAGSLFRLINCQQPARLGRDDARPRPRAPYGAEANPFRPLLTPVHRCPARCPPGDLLRYTSSHTPSPSALAVMAFRHIGSGPGAPRRALGSLFASSIVRCQSGAPRPSGTRSRPLKSAVRLASPGPPAPCFVASLPPRGRQPLCASEDRRRPPGPRTKSARPHLLQPTISLGSQLRASPSRPARGRLLGPATEVSSSTPPPTKCGDGRGGSGRCPSTCPKNGPGAGRESCRDTPGQALPRSRPTPWQPSRPRFYTLRDRPTTTATKPMAWRTAPLDGLAQGRNAIHWEAMPFPRVRRRASTRGIDEALNLFITKAQASDGP